ncbi:GLutaRedoXin [Datura stramonium]|uniref:GLutaRedoXin n=1 Tax=Datura stramonium TaxID=4076 RepID=A0ABS8RTZ5_DATST|nr:GLutaRedoXin [Datura stramonium]
MPRNRNFFPSSASSGSGGGSGSQQLPGGDQINNNNGARWGVVQLIAENAIVIICVLEIDEAETDAMLEELLKIKSRRGKAGEGPKMLPVVYIGGKLLGGVEKVVETHIKNELIPMLKAAGALWL